MRKSRFTESQIVEILKEGEAGVSVAEILRKHSIARGTYFEWRRKYAGALVGQLQRLKELEAENAKLKRMYAELALENAAIKDVLGRGDAVRETRDPGHALNLARGSPRKDLNDQPPRGSFVDRCFAFPMEGTRCNLRKAPTR